MANWSKKVFTKDERKHLAEIGINSKQDMINCRKGQAELSKKDGREICITCSIIAHKMGIES